jgi:FAD/FMN-containing dehydrogenase
MQAGCRIAELAETLRQHGLTLSNYASIREQAVGGFVQVRRVRWAAARGRLGFDGVLDAR